MDTDRKFESAYPGVGRDQCSWSYYRVCADARVIANQSTVFNHACVDQTGLELDTDFSAIAGIGALTALWAMTSALAAVVSALREATVLYGVFLAWLFLGEKIGRHRLLAIMVIAVEAMLLRAA